MPLRDLVFRIRADNQTAVAFTAVNRQLGNLKNSLGALAVGTGFAAGAAGAFALARGLSDTVRQGAEFERTMSGVRAVTKATGAEFKALNEQARTLGATTVFTAVEASTAMEELGKAGFEVVEILRVMPDVLNLAAAGTLEMGTAASITSDIVRSMGITLDDFTASTDILAATATNSKTTISELGSSFKDAGPVAKQLGLNLADLNGLLGILANRGLIGTRSGTALRRIFSVLLGDIEAGEKGLAGFNLTLFDSSKQFVGMASVLDQLREKGVGALEIIEAFGLRGGPAFLQLFDAGSDEIERFNKIFGESFGEGARIASERLDNLSGDARLFTSAMTDVRIEIFDQVNPALRSLVQGSTKIVQSWGRLIQGAGVWKAVRDIIVVTTAALGAFVVMATVRAFAALKGLADLAVQAAFGFNKTWVAIARNESALRVLNSTAALTSKLAFAGMAVAAFALGFELGRLIARLTGLDTVMSELWEKALKRADDVQKSFGAVRGQVGLLDRRMQQLRDQGFDLRIADELRAVQVAIRSISDEISEEDIEAEVQLRVSQGALKDADPQFFAAALGQLRDRVESELQGEAISFLADNETELKKLKETEQAILQFQARLKSEVKPEDLGRFIEIFNEAAEKGGSVTDQLRDAFDKYTKARTAQIDEEARAAIKQREAQEALEESIGSLEKRLNEAGLGTTRQAEALVAQLDDAKIAARELGLEESAVFRAYATDILEVQRQVSAANQEIPDGLKAARAEIDRLVFDSLNGLQFPIIAAGKATIDLRTELQKLGVETDAVETLRDIEKTMAGLQGLGGAELAQATINLESQAQILLNSIVPGFNSLVDDGLVRAQEAMRILLSEGYEALVERIIEAQNQQRLLNTEIFTMDEAARIAASGGFAELQNSIANGAIEVQTLNQTLTETLGNAAVDLATGLGDSLVEAISGGEDAMKNFFKGFVKLIAQMILRALILKQILNSIGLGKVTPFIQAGFGVLGNAFADGGIIPSADSRVRILRGGIPGVDSIPIGNGNFAQQGEAVLPADLTRFLVLAARTARNDPREIAAQDRATFDARFESQSQQQPLQVNMQMLDGAETVRRILEDNPEAVSAGIRRAVARRA